MAKNVEVKFEKEKMIITVDCAKEFGPSKSGKTVIIASTEGNTALQTASGKSVTLGLNVYRKN